MQWKVLMIALIATIALCVTGCSVQRTATTTDVRGMTSAVRCDTLHEQRLVEVHDTIREVTTITVQQNEAGDTVFRSVVTDRDRTRDRAAIRDTREKQEIRVDTVYVERRDSVRVQDDGFMMNGVGAVLPRATPVVDVLKWIFWIVLAVTVLLVVRRFIVKEV